MWEYPPGNTITEDLFDVPLSAPHTSYAYKDDCGALIVNVSET